MLVQRQLGWPFGLIVTLAYLLSGLLGLYVGLDYISRIAVLRRWNGGFEVIRALLAQAWPTELLQDYSGARALLFGGDAYETTGQQVERYVELGSVGLSDVVSTHPPTAFAVLLPLAPLPFGTASALWAALMIVGLIVTVWACGASWRVAALLGPLSLLAPPVAAAVHHLALPWLVLLCLAFRYRNKVALAGLLIGLASLTKFLPALLLIPFLMRAQWRAASAFALVWTAAIALVTLLNKDVLTTYLTIGHSAADVWLAEPSNGAFFLVSMRYGPWAVALAAALVLWVVWLDLRDRRSACADDRAQWARWNWLAIALLPITWTYSVLPLALSLVLLFQMRRWLPVLVGLAGFGPLLFTLNTASPFPAFFCTLCMGIALALDPLARPSVTASPFGRGREERAGEGYSSSPSGGESWRCVQPAE